MRRLLNLITVVGMLVAALGTTSVPFVFADCVVNGSTDNAGDGGSGNDTIDCSTDPTDGDINGGEGNDSITLGPEASATDVSGDNTEDGGDDSIVVEGSADNVYGDNAGYGGNDTITVNGDASYVAGDYSEYCWTEDHPESCNDTITINGEVDWVDGDNTYQCWNGDCNDTIVVNGDVNEQVTGDYTNKCKDNACNDTITVNEGGSAFFVVGDDTLKCGDNSCNDTITVNGEVGAVVGDNVANDFELFALGDEGFGGSSSNNNNDTITVNGSAFAVIGDNTSFIEEPFGESSGGYGGQDGNDTITVNGFVGLVVGDSVSEDSICSWCVDTASFGGYGNSGNDVITVSSTGTAGVVIGDSINSSTCFSGCVSGGSSASSNDTITVDGTVLGDVFGDSVDGFFGPAVAGAESVSGGSFTTRSDTITITGVVGGDVFADSDFGKGLLGVDEGFASNASIQDDTVILPSGGVQYIKKCGDINATLVGSSTPTASIGGTIYGGDWETHGDTLFIGLTTANGDDIAALQAQLDAAGENGSVTVGDHTYNWNDFEHVQVQGTVYSEGATQLFDNGVVTAYMGGDGKSIDVCYDPEGYGHKVSLVNFDELDKGVRQFSVGSEFTAIVNNDTSTCDPDYTPANANWKVELYQNGTLVDNHFCFIH